MNKKIITVIAIIFSVSIICISGFFNEAKANDINKKYVGESKEMTIMNNQI